MKKIFLFQLLSIITFHAFAQNVGIGTRTPNYTLCVKDTANTSAGMGIAQVSRNGLVAVGTFAYDNGDAYIQTHTSHDLNFATNNGFSQMILQNGTGNFGIGTTSPKARLHVADSSVVFSATHNPSNYNYAPPPIEGIGKRMMWYAPKGAFRAGYVIDTVWDKKNIGLFSTAFGYNTLASGDYSFAAGINTIAYGLYSTAINYESQALGHFSFAQGNTVAKTQYCVSIGHYNDMTDVNATNNNMFATDRLFQIGNGTTNTNRSNALTVLRSGNIGIGDVTPSEKLVVNGNTIITGNTSISGTLKLTGGTPAVGKLLTSDANGNASWQTAAPPLSQATSFFSIANSSQAQAQTIGNTSATIDFVDTYPETFDNGNNFNSNTDAFTAPTNGLYNFSYAVRFSQATATQNGGIFLYLKVNNSVVRSNTLLIPNGTNIMGLSISDGAILRLNAGDAVTVEIAQSTGATLSIFNNICTQFSGYKVY